MTATNIAIFVAIVRDHSDSCIACVSPLHDCVFDGAGYVNRTINEEYIGAFPNVGFSLSCLMSHLKLRPRMRQFCSDSKVAIKIIPSTRFKTSVRAQAAIRNEVEAMRVGDYRWRCSSNTIGRASVHDVDALPSTILFSAVAF